MVFLQSNLYNRANTHYAACFWFVFLCLYLYYMCKSIYTARLQSTSIRRDSCRTKTHLVLCWRFARERLQYQPGTIAIVYGPRWCEILFVNFGITIFFVSARYDISVCTLSWTRDSSVCVQMRCTTRILRRGWRSLASPCCVTGQSSSPVRRTFLYLNGLSPCSLFHVGRTYFNTSNVSMSE